MEQGGQRYFCIVRIVTVRAGKCDCVAPGLASSGKTNAPCLRFVYFKLYVGQTTYDPANRRHISHHNWTSNPRSSGQMKADHMDQRLEILFVVYNY